MCVGGVCVDVGGVCGGEEEGERGMEWVEAGN